MQSCRDTDFDYFGWLYLVFIGRDFMLLVKPFLRTVPSEAKTWCVKGIDLPQERCSMKRKTFTLRLPWTESKAVALLLDQSDLRGKKNGGVPRRGKNFVVWREFTFKKKVGAASRWAELWCERTGTTRTWWCWGSGPPEKGWGRGLVKGSNP